MRKVATFCLVAGLPGAAFASGSGFDVGSSILQMFGSLILVVGIILILYYLAGRYLKLPQAGGTSRYIRVVETRHLAPKKSLVLVEVGGEYLLLSNSGEGVNLLSKVDMLEEIEVVEESAPQIAVQQLTQRLRSLAASRRRFQIRKTGGL